MNMNRFAEACYDQNSIQELEAALNRAPDYTDMKEWGLTEDEYFAQLQEAIDAKLADKQ
jgi:hypothetical protein